MALALVMRMVRERPELVLMEGTGLAGGTAAILARMLGIRYVVSSGDAVGPFLAARSAWLAPIGIIYERLLCRLSAGFLGWTPYLTGRAITLGAPRAATLPGWGLPPAEHGDRDRFRNRWGVSSTDIVVGIVGNLVWNRRRRYCYGLELVRSVAHVRRSDLVAVIVGDGDGRAYLEREIGADGGRVVVTGAVPRSDVRGVLAAMDLASLPQSLDRVGMFRYSTKLPEYLSAGLPVITGQLPLAYDLDGGWLVRLPGDAPWDEQYISALREVMQAITWDDIGRLRECVPRAHPVFEIGSQQRRVRDFLADVL